MRVLSWTSPRWLSLLIGLAAIGTGAALTLKPFSSLDALTLFIGVSLILAGLGEFLTDESDSAPLVSKFVGAILAITGLVAIVLRDQTIRTVAIVVGAGLVASGLSRLWSVLRGQTNDRYVTLVGGLAAVGFGVLSLAWPDATILVMAVLVGPIAVIFGIGQVLRALGFRQHAKPASKPEIAGSPSAVHHVVRLVRVTASLIIALALIGVSTWIHNDTPTVSAFYNTPKNLPDTPGQLIRSDDFDRGLPDNSRAKRLLFSTTALDGSIGVASAIVVIPRAAPAAPWPVLLWEHGTTGIARHCAPSILSDPLGSGAMPAQQQAIDNGWVIVVPDYIGLGSEGPHPYLIGVPTAQSSLDAVRAARQLDGLSLSNNTVVWGHSQGGGAALWVGIEAATYAPDVPLLGIAAMAPAADLAPLAPSMLESPAGALFGAYIIEAYSKVYPDVKFDDYVRASARALLESVANRCLSDPGMLVSLGVVLSGASESVFSQQPSSGPLAARLAENAPATPTGLPTFLGQGLSDPLILPEVQAQFVSGLCSAGQIIEYHTYAGRDHVGVVADDSPMIPDLLAWTKARFAGDPAPTECSTTEK
jgi:uncharacterized membrane protein HdeD (DUF308 family)/acetyl esterase/lipase